MMVCCWYCRNALSEFWSYSEHIFSCWQNWNKQTYKLLCFQVWYYWNDGFPKSGGDYTLVPTYSTAYMKGKRYIHA